MRITIVAISRTNTSYGRYTSGDGGNLRLLLIHLRLQTFDTLLKLTVGGGVDERIDTAVGELQHSTEVVEPVNDAMMLIQLIRRL